MKIQRIALTAIVTLLTVVACTSTKNNSVEIIPIQDNLEPRLMPLSLFPEANDSLVDYLELEKGVPSSVSTFLLKCNDKITLFDAGLGAPDSQLLSGIKSAGVEPYNINYVILTHLHGDHIGGLVIKGEATFANAKLYIPKSEYDYWSNAEGGTASKLQEIAKLYGDKMILFESSDELPCGIEAIEAYGHSPGHTMYKIGKNLIAGDIMHGVLLQLTDPEVCAKYDMDKAKAIKARKMAIDMATKEGLTMYGMHFPYPYKIQFPIDKGRHELYSWRATGNPIITHKHSADPAPFVKGDTLWLYTGCDYQGNQSNYRMYEWNLYSTTDMINWTEHATPLHVDEFKWQNSHAAYAGHVIERNGKWYFYVSTNWCGIGVAVADSPYGPFKDAIGKQLLTTQDCPGTTHSWACIDPFVTIDQDGQVWILWGNGKCFIAKLKENMVEIDGEVREIPIAGTTFTEAPWVHKHGDWYYLTFAEGWPEKIGYAMSKNIDGPYEYKGILSEMAGNCNTTHPAVVTFKGKDWFFTHNGALPEGTSYSRSVCAQPLGYAPNGELLKCDIVTQLSIFNSY